MQARARQLLYEHAPEQANKLAKVKVGLFLECIVKDNRFATLVNEIRAHEAWSKELTKRRDPSAHRIPLYVPPQILTPEETRTYHKFIADYSEGMAMLDFEAAEGALDGTESLGHFVPHFLHDADDGPIPIYPTVPDDVAHALQLLDAVGAFLEANT